MTENFNKPPEVKVDVASASAESSSKLRTEAQDTTNDKTAPRAVPGELSTLLTSLAPAFKQVSDFIAAHTNSEGKLDLGNVKTKDLQTVAAVSQKTVDAVTEYKTKLVANLDVAQVNLKQFG